MLRALIERRQPPVRLLEDRSPRTNLRQHFNSVGRQADNPIAAAEITRNTLPNPPVNVSRKCVASLWVELFNAVCQVRSYLPALCRASRTA